MQVLEGIEGLLRKQEIALKNDEASSIRAFKDKLGEVEAQVGRSVDECVDNCLLARLPPLTSSSLVPPFLSTGCS